MDIDIKKLRIIANSLINSNIKNIDRRQVDKFRKIALTSRKDKVNELIDNLTIMLQNIKNDIKTNNRKKNLKGIIPNKKQQLKQHIKEELEIMDKNNNKQKIKKQSNKKIEEQQEEQKIEEQQEEQKNEDKTDKNIKLYVSADIVISYIKKSKNNVVYKPFDKPDEVKMEILIPESKRNDKQYINNYIVENCESYLKDPYIEYFIVGNILVKNYNYISDLDYKKYDKNDLFMNSASYPNITISDVKYEHEPFKCVYGALKYYYNYNEDYLFNIFKEYTENKQNIKKNCKLLDEGIFEDELIEDDNENKNNFDEMNYENFNKQTGVNTNMLMYLAEKNDFSLYAFDWNNQLFNKYISKNQNLKPLCYILANNHMYIITDKKLIKSIAMKSREYKSTNSTLFREIDVKKHTFDLEILDNIIISQLKNYTKCNIMYSCNNLDKIHYLIYTKNNDLITKVITSGCKIIYMYYERFNLHIYADINFNLNLNIDYKTIREICKTIKIDFKNQSIANVMLDYEKFYYGRSKRKVLSKNKREELVELQQNKCNICEKDISAKGTRHFDHIIPIASGGLDSFDNIQALCIGCHLDKTNTEKQEGDYVNINPTESSFNKITEEIFNNDNSKTNAFIERINNNPNKKIYKYQKYIDINKCRRNILLYNKYDYPVYTVLDKPEFYNKKDKIKTGYYYVETNNNFPMRGCGWYSHVMIEYCLKENIITKKSITHILKPSLSIKHDYFKKFIECVVEKFDIITKQAVNILVGCFNKKSTLISKWMF